MGKLNSSRPKLGKIQSRGLLFADTPKKPNKPSENDKKVKVHKFIRHIENYCENTSLHGLRYMGDIKLSYGERLFWFGAFIIGIAFATYFIADIYDKYDSNPVIIALNPTKVPLFEVPFPAVTICNLNQAEKDTAEDILANGTTIQKKLLNDYCNPNATTSYNNGSELYTWQTLKTFMQKIAQPCSDMFEMCKWREAEVNCTELFTTSFTDDGLCCTFNQLPKSVIYTDAADIVLDEPKSTHSDETWTPEKGFAPNAPRNSKPWRPAGAGVHLGLTLVLNAELDNTYCTSTNSVGFKVSLANPLETPNVANFGFLVAPGVESRIIISPTINDAVDDLLAIEVEKRQCFFADERQLKFFRTYSEKNCRQECLTNFTLDMCNCVPYFLPKGVNYTICSKIHEQCVNEAKLIMETAQSQRLNCDCLVGCFELGYSIITSFSTLSEKIVFNKDDVANSGDAQKKKYFKQNMAILHFFFADSYFRKYTKNLLFGFTEFLSSTGGLLGLFLGFSFLSAVEMGYYMSLRICCKVLRKRRNAAKDAATVFPFVK